MRRLLLLSMLLATMAIPAVGARDHNPQRGLRRTLLYTTSFYLVYWLALLAAYLHLD